MISNTILLYILMALYIPYGAFIWRLRGGAWSTFLNIKIGTNITRLVTGVLFSLPLILFVGLNYFLLGALTVAIPLGLILAGWGPYMNMTADGPVATKTWLDFFPTVLGFSRNTIPWTFAGMTVCGLIVFGLDSLAIGLSNGVSSWAPWLMLEAVVVSCSLLFSLVYLVLSKIPAEKFLQIPGFARGPSSHAEWSEVTVGGLVSLSILVMLWIAGYITAV